MHVSLTYPKTTKPFLEQIDRFFLKFFSPDAPGLSPEDAEPVRQLVYLDSFRDQFREFLARYGLPTNVCEEDLRWFQFLTAYAGVIEDGELVYAEENLEMVREMKFQKAHSQPHPEARIPFTIQWTVTLKDGREFEMSLHPNWNLLGMKIRERKRATIVQPPRP
jgi:hypothetical protein